MLAHLKLEYGTKEAFLSVRLEGTGDAVGAGEASSIEEGGVRRLLSLLSLLPHGVVKMSHDLEGLVRFFFVLLLFLCVCDLFCVCVICRWCRDVFCVRIVS